MFLEMRSIAGAQVHRKDHHWSGRERGPQPIGVVGSTFGAQPQLWPGPREAKGVHLLPAFTIGRRVVTTTSPVLIVMLKVCSDSLKTPWVSNLLVVFTFVGRKMKAAGTYLIVP